MRRRTDTLDYPAVLASPDAVTPDGLSWTSREAWEYGVRAWPHPSWDGGLGPPDEPCTAEDF
jgi:hypothetical protein